MNPSISDLAKGMKGINLSVKESDTPFNYETGNFAGRLKEFDFAKDLPVDPTVIIDGKRGSGKTFFLRDMMFKLKDRYPMGLVFTKTGKLNKFWQAHVPDQYIHNGYEPLAMEKLMKEQEKMIEQGFHKHMNIWKFVIFDDVVGEDDFHNHPELEDVFTLGRHLRLAVFFITQYIYKVSPNMRENTDVLVQLITKRKGSREAVADEFLGSLPRKEAMALIDSCTQDRHALVIFNRSISMKLEDYVFCNTAIDPGPFVLGCEEFWRGYSQHAPKSEPSQAQSTGRFF